MSSGTLIEAHRPPRYGVLVSVGINVTTAMLLVDYALHGLTTPTPWASAVASRLARPVRRRFDDVRAFLGHGAVVRDFLWGQLREDAPEHQEWPLFRKWLADLAQERVAEMIELGIVTNLDYYNDSKPSPEVEDLLSRIPRTAEGVPDFRVSSAKEAALKAIIAGWGVPRPASVLQLALNPEEVRDALLQILDALWAEGFEEAWATGRPRLLQAAAEAREQAARPGPLTPDACVAWMTGLQPNADIADLLRGAEQVVFAPCVQLGGYLSIVASGAARLVLYDPQASTPAGGTEGRSADQALDLASLGPALEALGDPNRLALLLRMRERGEVTAQQGAEDLGVHQSTISRHLARLEQAEMLWIRRVDGVRHYRVNSDRIRHVTDMLRRALIGDDGK